MVSATGKTDSGTQCHGRGVERRASVQILPKGYAVEGRAMKWLRIFMGRKKEHVQYSRGHVLATEEGWYEKAERLYGTGCKHCDGSGYCIDMPCSYCPNKEEE